MNYNRPIKGSVKPSNNTSEESINKIKDILVNLSIDYIKNNRNITN
ncbi:hypothetical protein JOC34_000656 [Virgibacillus halotolerans]|nr:hypothetical protein [Virgibacillus halotolerans]